MQTSLSRFPDLKTLTAGLTSIFGASESLFAASEFVGNGVVVMGREPNVFESSYPSEIVICQLDDGRMLSLLCKYGVGYSSSGHGHRGGVPYEAQVYRHILQSSRVSTPAFHGDYTDSTTGETWLITEYLENSWRVSKMPAPTSMELAARWIGLFHADSDAGLTGVSFPFLTTYDAEYYLGWALRTSQFAGDLPLRFPWLLSLCARFEEIVPSLLEPPLTVIHGEYTPHNVLYRQGIIYPVDWESAAFAAGEIDLAILTDSWSPEVVSQCEFEYQRARWPEGSPANFEQRFGAARLYTQFRWLGDQLRLGLNKNILGRLEQLRSVGERLGLI